MITLRPYQADGLKALWNYFEQGGIGNPLLAWPTGTGKSCVPAVFIDYALKNYPHQRFLVVTHVKELIKQNAEVLEYIWPTAPMGIYSAGLKRKDSGALPIIYGGIQSMKNNAAAFGHRDIIFVDEAHLVNQDEASMYNTFFATMRLLNPRVKIIGMSATPYRMGQGLLTDGGLFTDIVHDLTGFNNFNKLIADGYLCPLVPLRTQMQLDVSNVRFNKYDFIGSQLQSAVDKAETTYAGLKEVKAAGENRKKWLMFSSGIEHAEHIAEMLRNLGTECAAVHSKQKSEYNDAAIKAFREGKLRSIVNFGKLTTGFNDPEIDLIGNFRPTLSVPLNVQLWGRGTRMAPGKINCLGLDFARNTVRLGPINDPSIPKKKGEKVGDAPVKICESCGVYNHTKVRYCGHCGSEFEFAVKIVPKSGKEELLRSDFPQLETFDVQMVSYQKKDGKEGKPPYIRVGYLCNGRTFTENVFPEGRGFARVTFSNWWKQRHPTEPPMTADHVIAYQNQLRAPRRIVVHINKKYPEITSVEY